MSLDQGLDDIVTRLKKWKYYPKYSLERRVDIFLTPFLRALVANKLGGAGVQLVAPEFPLLSDLPKHGARARHSDLSARTANADYLLKREGPDAPWILLELKTDADSFSASQAALYEVACERGMKDLIRDLAFVQEKTEAKHRQKYQNLIDALPRPDAADDRIVVAYLGPRKMLEKARKLGLAELLTAKTFVALEDFADMRDDEMPPEFAALWPFVQAMLNAVCERSSVGS